MYAIDINRHTDNDIDIDNEFAELVEPVAVRAPGRAAPTDTAPSRTCSSRTSR